MNINEVYLRIIETENDSDVVQLAKKEVMVIPILINAMLDENNCRAQNILIDLSEQTPLLVYTKSFITGTIPDSLANKHLSWCIRIFNT